MARYKESDSMPHFTTIAEFVEPASGRSRDGDEEPLGQRENRDTERQRSENAGDQTLEKLWAGSNSSFRRGPESSAFKFLYTMCMRIVGTRNRSEIELNPVKAWQRGRELDAMLGGARPPRVRAVMRGTHEYFNRLDAERQTEVARTLNAV